MKRFGLALLLVTGGILLLLGSASTASALPMPPPPADYCGTNEIEVPDSGPAFNFSSACQAHDECYAAGGGPLARSRCDNQFLRDMNASCAEMWERGDPRLTRCRNIATLYYTAVRLGGWTYFYS
ncbi:MAG: phospholipase A2 [Dehalococcoidia bacterium]